MAKVKCKMTNCDYTEYDSELQAHICTYGPMCKILVLEEENTQLKKQFKSLYEHAQNLLEAVDGFGECDCGIDDGCTVCNAQKFINKIKADKIFGGE